MWDALRSILLYVPIGNCYICWLMTEGSFNDPHQHSSGGASATHSSQLGPRLKSLQQSDSVSAGISGQLGYKYFTLWLPPAQFVSSQLPLFVLFPQQGMLSATSASYKMFGLIHNVLCSLFKITPSTLRAAWDLVMPPLAARHVERKIKT